MKINLIINKKFFTYKKLIQFVYTTIFKKNNDFKNNTRIILYMLNW